MDLFCGIGGLTHGLRKAGIQVVAGIDSDDTCEFAYASNNEARFIKKDIRDISSAEIAALYPKDHLKILTGCAPCQPFSTHTQKNKNRIKDDKWTLLYSFQKTIIEILPEIVSMENVPQITKYEVFKDFTGALEKNGYKIFWKSVFCPDYGMPQARERLVLLASRLGDIELIPKTHEKTRYRTVRDAIGHLKPISNGEIDNKDTMHRSQGLTPINLKRIRCSKPGGTWRDWEKIAAISMSSKTGRSHLCLGLFEDGVGKTISDHNDSVLQFRYGSFRASRAG